MIKTMEYTEKELQQERWKPIFGYDGLYEVSSLGRVRSRYSGEWKVMRPRKYSGGYLMVMLYKNGKSKNSKIHRLVAQAFIPNSDKTKTIINHVNEIKTDNRVSNLEWCDYQYNNTYNDLHRRRNNPNYKRRKLKDLYDTNLSIQQNLEIFKANGIECCEKTIQRLRKELGISRKYNTNQ